MAATTSIPVIGVPIHTKTLSGVDSLYSIVQMPSGIPVATVAINGAKNAGILAAKILRNIWYRNIKKSRRIYGRFESFCWEESEQNRRYRV